MKPVVWQCEECGNRYDNQQAAAECEAFKRPKPVVSVGDIVKCRGGFGWYNGARHWVSNPTVKKDRKHRDGRNCFDACCCFEFFYVITAIDLAVPLSDRVMSQAQPKAYRYHLESLAMKSEGGHYRRGYTFVGTHHRPRKVNNPPARVVKESKALLGHIAESLL